MGEEVHWLLQATFSPHFPLPGQSRTANSKAVSNLQSENNSCQNIQHGLRNKDYTTHRLFASGKVGQVNYVWGTFQPISQCSAFASIYVGGLTCLVLVPGFLAQSFPHLAFRTPSQRWLNVIFWQQASLSLKAMNTVGVFYRLPCSSTSWSIPAVSFRSGTSKSYFNAYSHWKVILQIQQMNIFVWVTAS